MTLKLFIVSFSENWTILTVCAHCWVLRMYNYFYYTYLCSMYLCTNKCLIIYFLQSILPNNYHRTTGLSCAKSAWSPILSAWLKVSGSLRCLVSGRRRMRPAERIAGSDMRQGGRWGETQLSWARKTDNIPPSRPKVLQKPRLEDLTVVGKSSQV